MEEDPLPAAPDELDLAIEQMAEKERARAMNDGLVPVTLLKPWTEHAEGDTVRVDPERAAWMRDNGYGEAAPHQHPEFPGLRIEPVSGLVDGLRLNEESGPDLLEDRVGEPLSPEGVELKTIEPVRVNVDLGEANRLPAAMPHHEDRSGINPPLPRRRASDRPRTPLPLPLSEDKD